MTRNVEVEPGQMFAVADDVILMREWESILAHTEKFGGENQQVAFFFTFTGRVNNQAKVKSFTTLMSPEDAFALASHILDTIDKNFEPVEDDRPENLGD